MGPPLHRSQPRTLTSRRSNPDKGPESPDQCLTEQLFSNRTPTILQPRQNKMRQRQWPDVSEKATARRRQIRDKTTRQDNETESTKLQGVGSTKRTRFEDEKSASESTRFLMASRFRVGVLPQRGDKRKFANCHTWLSVTVMFNGHGAAAWFWS
jgi:hypothetical protein